MTFPPEVVGDILIEITERSNRDRARATGRVIVRFYRTDARKRGLYKGIDRTCIRERGAIAFIIRHDDVIEGSADQCGVAAKRDARAELVLRGAVSRREFLRLGRLTVIWRVLRQRGEEIHGTGSAAPGVVNRRPHESGSAVKSYTEPELIAGSSITRNQLLPFVPNSATSGSCAKGEHVDRTGR